ncbi:MAG TPA: hypothetical protein VGO09_04615 [Flavisolibacter sp.]|nr:hypothetical protein [Flavisolibacter sp.]
MMAENLVIRDPLYNRILIDFDIMRLEHTSVNPAPEEPKQVIRQPNYMVVTSDKRELYFFRSISPDRKLLIIAHISGSLLYVHECIENPDANYIASILRKGRLRSFIH